MRKKLASAAMVAGAALLLTSCAAGGGEGAKPEGPKYEITDKTAAPSGELEQLTWATYAEPFSLDYAYAFDYADNQVLANVCESLLRLEPDMTVSPGLATKWENKTPTTWVFTIREGVKFHDGSALTADDVVASMKRHIDPAVGSFWFSVYQNVDKIEKTGEISLTRFDDYWDKDLVAKTKKLDFVIMTDPVARINAMKSGEVDGGWMVPANAIDELNASGVGKVHFGLNTAMQFLVVSDLEGPLGNEEVRKALLMAIDRNGLVQAATQGYGKVSDSFTTESVWGQADEATRKAAFESLQAYPYDLDAATKIVEEQGVAGEEITITTAPMGNDFAVIAQATAAAAESIGLKAKINTVTPNAYTALFSDPEARKGTDLYYTSWYLSIGDPLEMFSILRTDDFSNYGNWSDADYDNATTDALSTMDPKERFAAALKSQEITNAHLPWLPLYESPNYLWMNDKITGPSPSLNFMYYPWGAEVGAK